MNLKVLITTKINLIDQKIIPVKYIKRLMLKYFLTYVYKKFKVLKFFIPQ